MKGLLRPRLPRQPRVLEELDAQTLALLADGEDIQDVRFVGVTFEGLTGTRAEFRACIFERCTFLACEGVRFGFMDAAFLRCELSGADFSGGAFQRVLFEDCRCLGVRLQESLLMHAALSRCQMQYANLAMGRFKFADFEDCKLSQACLAESEMKNTQFARCELTGAEFVGTKLKGMDLRTNEISGIVLGGRGELMGATVSPLQACDLARLLGVTIRSEDEPV